MSFLATDFYDLSDFDNLQMNMILLNYLNLSQSGTYDYLFDTDYHLSSIKPKFQVIKRSSPVSKPSLVKTNNIINKPITPKSKN